MTGQFFSALYQENRMTFRYPIFALRLAKNSISNFLDENGELFSPSPKGMRQKNVTRNVIESKQEFCNHCTWPNCKLHGISRASLHPRLEGIGHWSLTLVMLGRLTKGKMEVMKLVDLFFLFTLAPR